MSNLGKWKRFFIGAVVGGIIGSAQSSWVDPDSPAVEKTPQRRALTPGDDRQYNLVCKTPTAHSFVLFIPKNSNIIRFILHRFFQMSLK